MRARIPLFEKPAQAESDELENRLDDKNHREDVIAVLQDLLEVLQDMDTHTSTTHCSCSVSPHAASLLWF